MPALIFFRQKWLVACDDLVIPFAVEVVCRIACLTAASAITWLHMHKCDESLYDDIFLYAVVADLLISSCLTLGLSFISSKGSVLEVHKRKNLSKVLYLKLLMVLFDCAIASYGTWIFIQGQNTCIEKDTFIKVITIFAWLYIFAVVAGAFIAYNSMGSSKYWNIETTSNSINFFKKAERIWRLRLKFFCCCADISENNDFIYVEISTFLASFLNGIDLVPTDILAGIIALSGIHAIRKRKQDLILQSQWDSEKALENRPLADWMTTNNALYFLRIAKSTYGWLAFFDVLHPWNICTLISCGKCCTNCFCSTEREDCCYCNSAAVQKITGFSESDILYASFRNSIYKPAFYVAIDHQTKYVIIAISGTRSFSDLVTDIDADVETFPMEKSSCKFKCHRGVLRSAMFLLKTITERNVLNTVFSEHPSYKLALTGHSLGASIAVVLGLLLYPLYPDLQCFAFSPIAVLSEEGISLTLDFVFAVVIGDDMAPRLCVNSCKQLRVQLLKSLEETKVPKVILFVKY